MADANPTLGLFAQMLGRAVIVFSNLQPMLPTYIHLIASALFPIYAGAHASLTRPSSAAKSTKRKHTVEDDATDEDEDEEEDQDNERLMEGLSPTDALLMPLFAGIALASLYFLLKWLKDPALLNRILNAYFAIFGVFSVSRLVADVLGTGHSIIFPRRYALNGRLYHLDAKEKRAVPADRNVQDQQAIVSPLPGFLARIPCPASVTRILWADRAMPGHKLTLRLYLRGVFESKLRIGPHGFVGLLTGLVVTAYFNLIGKPWYLTNLLGFGFSYGALQLMSPTTFATGSLVLGALFFYDIYFVFYTPMMVTVARSLDVPIKLVFPRPAPVDDPTSGPSYAMLGLGDVVLPGIMIGLALRFDLFLFYLRQQKQTPAATSSQVFSDNKPRYHSLAGRWSDYFWTHSLTGRPLWAQAKAPESQYEVPYTFSKVYFTASLVGYVLGMLATLGVMVIWNHAQPALLYLVPGVLGSLWLTALVRGEMHLMWNYTEEIAGEEEKKDAKRKDAKNAENTTTQAEAEKSPSTKEGSGNDSAAGDDSSTKKAVSEANQAHMQQTQRLTVPKPERQLFSFSVEAPWALTKPRSTRKDAELKKTCASDHKRN